MQDLKDIVSIAYESPGWTFTYLVIVGALVSLAVSLVADFLIAALKTVNIATRGWPPAHLDGAGLQLESYELDEEDNDGDGKRETRQ